MADCKHPVQDIKRLFQMVCQFSNGLVCPPATSQAGARPLEGQLSLQINECLGAISFEKAFSYHSSQVSAIPIYVCSRNPRFLLTISNCPVR
jgi:hypothetical protein